MTSPERKPIVDVTHSSHRPDKGQLFPPLFGPEKERAEKAMNNIGNIEWPPIIDTSQSYFKQLRLSAMALEFVDLTLGNHSLPLLDFEFRRHEVLLRGIRQDINQKGFEAGQTLEKKDFPPHQEEETKKALESIVRERRELHAAENEATTIVWYKTDNNPIRLHRTYMANPGDLSPEIQLLLRVAQNYLVWETFADRKGYSKEETPNIWEKLIEMYADGMYSFRIDPETNEFSFSMQVRDGKTIKEQQVLVSEVEPPSY